MIKVFPFTRLALSVKWFPKCGGEIVVCRGTWCDQDCRFWDYRPTPTKINVTTITRIRLLKIWSNGGVEWESSPRHAVCGGR